MKKVMEIKGNLGLTIRNIGLGTAIAAAATLMLPVSAWAGTYNIADGSIVVSATSSGTTVKVGTGSEVSDDEEIILTGTSNSTSKIVKISAEEGTIAKVTFSNLNITCSEYSAPSLVSLDGEGDVEIELDNANMLKVNRFNSASILRKDDRYHSGKLTIKDDNGTSGSLDAISGGSKAATIGSGSGGKASNITISGGTVTATTCNWGAAIGSGYEGDAENIIISGGIVNAKGAGAGTPIGAGAAGTYHGIYITGGEVTTISTSIYSEENFGIGSEYSYSKAETDGELVISGGRVTVTGGIGVRGESYKASDYPEVKDTAEVTIKTQSYPSTTYHYDAISTCELLEGGYLRFENSSGAEWETINGAAGNTHQWGGEVESEQYIISEAVCDQPAVYYKSCQKCGMKDTETFASDKAPGHLYKNISGNEPWWYNDTIHCHECLRENCPDREGSHIDAAEHTFTSYEWEPDNEYCSTCGYYKNHSHNLSGGNIQLKEATEPTCTKNGYKTHYQCKECKKLYDYDAAQAGSLVEVDKSDIEITAEGHKADAYEQDSVRHYKICTVCDSEFDQGKHDYVAGDTYTEDIDGVTYKITKYTCSVCERSYTVKEKVKDDDDSKDTESYADNPVRNSERYKTTVSSTTIAGGSRAAALSGWVQDASGRWWYYDNNDARQLGWIYDKTDGKWYYVDADKGRLTGWFYDTESGYWYYLDTTTGAMLTGWQLINGRQYFLADVPPAATYSYDSATAKWHYDNPSGYRPYGSMYAGTTTPDNHSVDADGAKIQ